MKLTARHFALVVSLSLVIHAALASTLPSPSAPPGAQAAGEGGIEVSLGAMGGAPGTVESVEASETELIEAAEVPAERAETIEPVETSDAVEQAQPVEPLETPPQPESDMAQMTPSQSAAMVPPEPAAAVEMDVPDVRLPDAIAAANMARPNTAEAAEPETPPPPPVDAAQTHAPPKPVQEIAPAEAVMVASAEPVAEPPADTPPIPAARPTPPVAEPAEPAPPQEASPAAVASIAGAAGVAGSQDSREAGTAASQSAGGIVGASADYVAHLQAWLRRHQKYPRSAKRKGQEGTALLYFAMDRSGHVQQFSIRESSGIAVLDDEVLALVERAVPLPRPPPEVAGAVIRVLVPVQFDLR